MRLLGLAQVARDLTGGREVGIRDGNEIAHVVPSCGPIRGFTVASRQVGAPHPIRVIRAQLRAQERGLAAREPRRPAPEVGDAQPAHRRFSRTPTGRGAGRRCRPAAATSRSPPPMRAGAATLHRQQRAERRRAAGAEVVPAGEVAERVRDQPARGSARMPRRTCGPEPGRGRRPRRPRRARRRGVAAVLAEGLLVRRTGRAALAGALGAPCKKTTTISACAGRLVDERATAAGRSSARSRGRTRTRRRRRCGPRGRRTCISPGRPVNADPPRRQRARASRRSRAGRSRRRGCWRG